jgi:hypothetical protein
MNHMTLGSIRIRAWCALLAAVVLLGASRDTAQQGGLPHLAGIDDLKAWFNANQGHPRLIFLLSPT